MLSGFISVDIETAGPIPGAYSLLALGACLVESPDIGFYAELQPTSTNAIPEALAVSGLTWERLTTHGRDPADAMLDFAGWVESSVPDGVRPVFVAFNAPFDWMFVADHLHRLAGRNPFGHSAVDIKALFMGRTGRAWEETSFSAIAAYFGLDMVLPHHALEDARMQAELFRRIVTELPDD